MSAMVTRPPPSDETVAAMVPGFSAEDIAEMRRAFHNDLDEIAKDVKEARKMVKTAEAVLRGYFVGASKVGDGGYSSTLYFVISDFPDPDHCSGVADARSKDMKEADRKNNVDFDNDRIWTVDEARAMGRDDDGIVRKVLVDFKPFQFLSLGNEPQLTTVEVGTEATVKIELSVWHDKESNTIAVRHKIVSVTEARVCPPEMLVMALFLSGKYTHEFRTEVGYYRKYMFDNHGSLTDREKASARYRERTFIIPIGFEDYMGMMFARPDSMVAYDNTDISTKLKENFVDARPGVNKPRFLCELIVQQWKGPSRKEATNVMRCMINVPMYESLFAGLDWSDTDAFMNIFPYLRQGWRMMVVCTEDAEKTLMSKLTQSRLFDVDGHDVEALNKPAADGGLSFAMNTMTRGILASPCDFLRSVGIEVTAEAIKKHLWKGKPIPLPAPDTNKTVDLSKPIICLSEISGDVSAVLNDPRREFRVLVPIQSQTITHLSEIGRLQAADGSAFLGYIKECVVAKKGSALPKDRYLKNFGYASLPADHFINKHDFTAASPNSLFYVFAIDREYFAAQRAAFLDKLKSSTSGFLNDVAGLLEMGPSPLAPRLLSLDAPPPKKRPVVSDADEPSTAPAPKRARATSPSPPPPSLRGRAASPPPPAKQRGRDAMELEEDEEEEDEI